MYAYQKKRLAKVLFVTIAIVIVGILVIIPNISQIANSLNQVIPIAQNNLQSITTQQSSQQGEQSPYGPKETQYYIQELQSSPLYPNLLDCSDSQLIHLLVLVHKTYPTAILTEQNWGHGSYLDDPTLGIIKSANLQNLFETYHC